MTDVYANTRLYRGVQICSLVSIPLVLGAFVVILRMDRQWAVSLLLEDSLFEWLQVLCMLTTSILALVLARRIRRRSRAHYLFFLLLGAAFALFVLEEISWGQRILDIKSPKFFRLHNDQREINIHNTLQQWFNVYTRDVGALCLLVYGVCLPLIVFIKTRGSSPAPRTRVVPPVVLVGGFLIAIYFLYFDTLGPYDTLDAYGEELGEFFASLCFVFFLVLELLKLDPRGADVRAEGSAGRRVS